MTNTPTKPDLQFENHGSIVTCTPMTDAGRDWIADNVDPEPWQWFGHSLTIEPRYLEAIVLGARADGLVCHG